MPDVAAVIANRNGATVLGECLASLRSQTQPPVETLVVDAESRDRSHEIAEEHGATFLVRPNRGLGFLYNEGARAARSPFVLVTNNDVVFDGRCVELLAAALAEDEQRFAADPRQVRVADGSLFHGHATLRRGPLLRELVPGLRLDQLGERADVAPTVQANAGAMLVRREMLLELGGFDETFFLDFEDLDLCWRAWLRGWASVYVPNAGLRHHVGAGTTSAVLPRRLRSSHHNLLRFALKCLPAREASVVVAAELLRLGRHPHLVAPALGRIVVELPEILRERRRVRPSRAFMRWVLEGMP